MIKDDLNKLKEEKENEINKLNEEKIKKENEINKLK